MLGSDMQTRLLRILRYGRCFQCTFFLVTLFNAGRDTAEADQVMLSTIARLSIKQTKENMS